MARFPEAEARKLRGIYVCHSCKSKIRAPSLKVIQGKVSCRKCRNDTLRPARKK